MATSMPDDLRHIAAAIATDGWSCEDDFIAPGLVSRLRAEAGILAAKGEFRTAAVGMGAHRSVRADIRSDEIAWLRTGDVGCVEEVTQCFEALRLALNCELQLGLFEHEMHFAHYAPGTFYARHIDAPAGSAGRVLSTVLYLNDAWEPRDGGELRLHVSTSADPHAQEFAPLGGRLVAFLSGQFEHEVLPARRERLSLTGWFRERSSLA